MNSPIDLNDFPEGGPGRDQANFLDRALESALGGHAEAANALADAEHAADTASRNLEKTNELLRENLPRLAQGVLDDGSITDTTKAVQMAYLSTIGGRVYGRERDGSDYGSLMSVVRAVESGEGLFAETDTPWLFLQAQVGQGSEGAFILDSPGQTTAFQPTRRGFHTELTADLGGGPGLRINAETRQGDRRIVRAKPSAAYAQSNLAGKFILYSGVDSFEPRRQTYEYEVGPSSKVNHTEKIGLVVGRDNILSTFDYLKPGTGRMQAFLDMRVQLGVDGYDLDLPDNVTEDELESLRVKTDHRLVSIVHAHRMGRKDTAETTAEFDAAVQVRALAA